MNYFSVTKLIKQDIAEILYYFLRVDDNLKSLEPTSFWVQGHIKMA